MHSPSWQASNRPHWPSFWQVVSQLPATQILPSEQSALCAHSTQAPSMHVGLEPKQSSLVLHVLGITQRDSSHVQTQNLAHSSSRQIGCSGTKSGFSQAQLPPVQVLAGHSASELHTVKSRLQRPSMHLFARQSTLPRHSPEETAQRPTH